MIGTDAVQLDGPHATRGIARWSLAAAALLALGVVVQLQASFERWPAPTIDDPIESHEHDYLVPSTPWEPIGVAAQLQGVGFLLVAAATIAAVVAVRASMPRVASGVLVALGAAAAASPALLGIHALASGVLGTPSPLEAVVAGASASFAGSLAPMLWTVVQVGGLAGVAVLAARRAPLLALGVALLAGSSHVGVVVGMVAIAPMLAGTMSYDTTPWSEAAFAMLQAPAVVALAAVAVAAVVRSRPREAAGDEVALASR